MAYIPGLDLNTQIQNEASKAALEAGVTLAVSGLAALGFLPKAFAGAKTPTDIALAGASILFKPLVDELERAKWAEEQRARGTTESQPKASGDDVVGF